MIDTEPRTNNSITQPLPHGKLRSINTDPLTEYQKWIDQQTGHTPKTIHSTKSQLSAFFKDPFASPSSKWLKTQYEHGFISNKTLIKQYQAWSKTPFAINLKHKITGEIINIKQVKRGTERFRRRTYARLYKACSEWILCHPTIKYSTDNFVQYKKIRRRIHMNNLMIITLTYKQKITSKHRAQLWKNIMKDFNRWWTGLKQKLPIKYYIAATEGHKTGNPHLHLIVKLLQPLKTIKIGKYYRFLAKERIEASWKQYGNVDIKAVSYNTHNPIGYIAKYIIKKIEDETPQQTLLTQAHKWINRKHTFTNTRNKTLKAYTNAHMGFNLLFNLDLPLKKGTNYQVESYDYNGTIIQVSPDSWEPLTERQWRDISYLGYIKRRILHAYLSYISRKRHYKQSLLQWSNRIFSIKQKKTKEDKRSTKEAIK